MSDFCRSISKVILTLGILGSMCLLYVTIDFGIMIACVTASICILSTLISFVLLSSLGEILDYLENIQIYLKPNPIVDAPITKLSSVYWICKNCGNKNEIGTNTCSCGYREK